MRSKRGRVTVDYHEVDTDATDSTDDAGFQSSKRERSELGALETGEVEVHSPTDFQEAHHVSGKPSQISTTCRA